MHQNKYHACSDYLQTDPSRTNESQKSVDNTYPVCPNKQFLETGAKQSPKIQTTLNTQSISKGIHREMGKDSWNTEARKQSGRKLEESGRSNY